MLDKRKKLYKRNVISSVNFKPKALNRSIPELLSLAKLRRNEPWVCHDLIDEARSILSLDEPEYDRFNDTVKEINNYWKSLPRYRWYDEYEFWSYLGEPQNVKYLDKIGE